MFKCLQDTHSTFFSNNGEVTWKDATRYPDAVVAPSISMMVIVPGPFAKTPEKVIVAWFPRVVFLT